MLVSEVLKDPQFHVYAKATRASPSGGDLHKHLKTFDSESDAHTYAGEQSMKIPTKYHQAYGGNQSIQVYDDRKHRAVTKEMKYQNLTMPGFE